MSQPQKGPLLRVKIGDGGSPEAFTLLGGVRSKTMGVSGDRIDVTSDDDIDVNGVSRRTYITGVADNGLSCSGVSKDYAASRQLIADAQTGAIRNFEIEWVSVGVWRGPFVVSNYEVTGESDGAIGFNLQLSPSKLAGVVPAFFPETAAPVNTVLPSIAGIAQVGAVLTAMTGVWTGSGITFTYQWQVDAAGNGTFANVAGATSRTYTPVVADQTDRVRVIVTATNTAGAASATSAPTVPTIAA